MVLGYGAGYSDGRSCCCCFFFSCSLISSPAPASISIPRLCSSHNCFRLSSLRLCAAATWQEAASFIHVSCSWEHRGAKSQEYRQFTYPWGEGSSITACSALINYDSRLKEPDGPVHSFHLNSPELLLSESSNFLNLPGLTTDAESTESHSEANASNGNGTIFCENSTRGKLTSLEDSPKAQDFASHLCSEEGLSMNVEKDHSDECSDSAFLLAPVCVAMEDARPSDESGGHSDADSRVEEPYHGPFTTTEKRDVNEKLINDMDGTEINRDNDLQALDHNPTAITLHSQDEISLDLSYYSGWEELSIEDALRQMEEIYSTDNYLEKCICLLRKCRDNKGLVDAMNAYASLCNSGLELHRLLISYLVSMFVECDSLRMAQQIFNKSTFHNEYSWTYLIQGYIGRGDPEHSLNIFFGMVEAGVKPGKYTYVAVLVACARLKCIERGCQIHTEIVKEGFEEELLVARSLVDFYAKCGLSAEAKALFDEFPRHRSNLWTSRDAAMVGSENDKESPEDSEDMQGEGLSAVAVRFIYNLKACGSIKDLQRGHELHIEILKEGLEVYNTVCNTLIDMYAKCDSISEAFQVLRKMPSRDVVSWTALIMGCVECGLHVDALLCLEKMQEENVCPNAFTYVSCLKACGIMKALDAGRRVHARITKEGWYTDLAVCNSVVDMYAKCGSLEEAQNIFDRLAIRDIIGWTSLIAGYAHHGTCEEVLECFEAMQKEGVVPNSLTFVCCLKACANMRDSHMGQRLHNDLVVEGFEDYKFVGNALLSMYARCGLYIEARAVMHDLQSRDVISWTALISEYAEDGLGQEALNTFDEMCEEGVSPNSITYMCCLKACGSVGALAKGKKLHIDITKRGLEKNPFIRSMLVDMYAACGKQLELDIVA